MGDAINFGPAWLRKVSSDSNPTSNHHSTNSSSSSSSHHSSHTMLNNNSSSSSSSTVVNNAGGGGGVGLHHQHHPHHHSQSPSSSHSSSHHSQHSLSQGGSTIGSGSVGGGGNGTGGSGLSNSSFGGGSGGGGSALVNNGGTGSGSVATTTTAIRYPLAEFRYGREEMLALFDGRTIKTPEILVQFKRLFVDKPQPPLALTPCPEEELIVEPESRRPWPSRSVSLGIPGRGARGGSVDRGRGRGRGLYTSYQRSSSFYEDESRGVGRGERPWLDRNGTGGIGADTEWNSSSSSPRKEYGTRVVRTGGAMESWRRSRTDDESTGITSNGVGDWRSGGGAPGSITGLVREKWTRSTSWRDEDSSTHHGLDGRGLNSSGGSDRMIPPYKSRLSSGVGLGSGGGVGDLNSGHPMGPGGMRRPNWDTDELPEWATENPSDFGGSFDATGAFHDSDNDGESGGGGGGTAPSRYGGNASDANGNKTHNHAKDEDRSKDIRRRAEDGELTEQGSESRRDGTEDTTGKNRSDGSTAAATMKGREMGKSVNHVGSRVEEASMADRKECDDDEENQQSSANDSQQKQPRSKRQVGKDGNHHGTESSAETVVLSENSANVQSNSTKGISSSHESIESSVSSTISGTAPTAALVDGDVRQNSPSWQAKANEGSGAKNATEQPVSVGDRDKGNDIDHNDGQKHHAPQQQLPLQHEKRVEPKKSPSNTSVDRMQEVADDMVAQLIMDDEFLATDGDPSVISSIAASSAGLAGAGGSLGKSPVFGMSATGASGANATMASGNPPLYMLPQLKALQPMQQLFGNGNLSRVNPLLLSDSVAANQAAMAAATGGVNPMAQLHHLMGPKVPPRGSDIWYYCDPQGKVQGPFQASEMTEWYRAGYFDESLSVRRECDEVYNTLGTLVALCGGIPFLNSAVIQPFKTSAGSNVAKHSPQQQQTQPSAVSQGQQKQVAGPGANGNAVMPSPNQQQSANQGPGQQQPQQQQAPLHPGSSVGSGPNSGPNVPGLHFLRQQSIVLQKLQSSEGWNLLSPEQQNMIITQQMNQLMNSDPTRIGMISPSSSLPGAGNAGNAAGTNQHHQQQQQQGGAGIFSAGASGAAAGIMPSGPDTLVNLKLREMQQQQGQSLQPPQPQQQPPAHVMMEQLQKSVPGNHSDSAFLKLHLPEFNHSSQAPGVRPMLGNMNVDPTTAAAVAARHDPLGQLMGIGFNHQAAAQNIGPLGPNNLLLNRGGLLGSGSGGPAQQSQPPNQPHQQQSHPAVGKPGGEDPLQSLFMQLSLHKNQQASQQIPNHQPPSKSAGEMMGAPAGWLQSAAGQTQAANTGTGLSGLVPRGPMVGAASSWGELPPPTSASFASIMQQQQQPHLALAGHHPMMMGGNGPSNEPQAPSVVSLFKHHQQAEKQQQMEKEQQQHQLLQQQQQQQQLQQMHQENVLAQQKQHQHLQQSQHVQENQQHPHLQQQLQQHQMQQQLQQHQEQQLQLQQQQSQPQQQQQQLQQQQQQQLQQQQQQLQQQQQQQKQVKENQKKESTTAIELPQQQSSGNAKKQSNKQQQQLVNNHAEVAEDKAATSVSMQQNQKSKKQQKNNHVVAGGNSNGQVTITSEEESEFIIVKKEMEEKKRLKKQQQEEQKRKLAEEKKLLEELQAQKRAKLLESQRLEAMKIQEQQQQQQQQRSVPKAVPAPWSGAMAEIANSKLSLTEIQKTERALLARREHSMREQQEQQQMLEMQSQLLDGRLKWNAQNLMPAKVKPLAEIQAEEAAAAERAREKNANASGLTVAAIAAQGGVKGAKKEDNLASVLMSGGAAGAGTGSAVWQVRGGSSMLYFNSTKAWTGDGVGDASNLLGGGGAGGSSSGLSNNVSSGGFWEEPTQPSVVTAASIVAAAGKATGNNGRKQSSTAGVTTAGGGGAGGKQQQQLLSKSKTMGSITTSSSSTVNAAKQQKQQQQQQQGATKGSSSSNTGKSVGGGKNGNVSGGSNDRKEDRKHPNEPTNEFTDWCTRALSSLNSNVDIPTFVGFLQDIESPFEVKDYIRLYLGENKECSEFAKQFLERRSKYKNQQRQKNAHIDDMCKPAPAINPSSNDFQETKGKNKKVKKNKMMKLDSRILGFSVTAAPDRLNVGERDYGDNV